MIPEKAIRERSYEIWLREGRPEGKAMEHWLRARSELEAEFQAAMSGSRFPAQQVVPRPVISAPPTRITSKRISAAKAK